MPLVCNICFGLDSLCLKAYVGLCSCVHWCVSMRLSHTVAKPTPVNLRWFLVVVVVFLFCRPCTILTGGIEEARVRLTCRSQATAQVAVVRPKSSLELVISLEWNVATDEKQ